ncbi:DUF3139 domain-containing protein [Staphylococcus auricularis]|uniref:DUF3139 domain-containing protein n=1 Tax=Staphylococcus auricularis TaxID=29379 RepID=A0ABX5IHQ6_9STAP|nr:DUF3139 domain-containing protein [Staphylococcus auricularis]MEB6570817.1 DUF3139 domain-containing protein [Staphylococcus auricularis]PTH18486.1 hypothetical protein BU607_04925 [Staphylococcus auricularis]
MKKSFKIMGSILIILIIVIVLVGINLYMYQKHEEEKIRDAVHHVFKQKGWEDKVKSEKNIFTYITDYNDLEVTFKDEPYNAYTYSFDENGKVTGAGILKDEYNKKPKHYKKSYDID